MNNFTTLELKDELLRREEEERKDWDRQAAFMTSDEFKLMQEEFDFEYILKTKSTPMQKYKDILKCLRATQQITINAIKTMEKFKIKL